MAALRPRSDLSAEPDRRLGVLPDNLGDLLRIRARARLESEVAAFAGELAEAGETPGGGRRPARPRRGPRTSSALSRPAA